MLADLISFENRNDEEMVDRSRFELETSSTLDAREVRHKCQGGIYGTLVG